jgi:hypothetical protein
MDLIRRFAREYRKTLGKAPGEIIIVGGGSIMLNYRFRDATQDFDVILHTSSAIKDVIVRFADENNLPRDWMNSDFMKTPSFSESLTEVSRHFCWLNNHSLEIRTVSGVYLIAMKMIACREYRNDISDAIGILIEEAKDGEVFTYDEIEAAYQKLYQKPPAPEIQALLRDFCSKSVKELKSIYQSQKEIEFSIGNQLITYVEENVHIDTKNVADIADRIREKMSRK